MRHQSIEQTELSEPLVKLREEIPAVFAGTELDRLTGRGYRWRTLQNEKCRGQVPDNMFLKSGRKNLIVRDIFLQHWQRKIMKVA